MTDQTLKDINRAFKALEERDELLDNIRAEIKIMSGDIETIANVLAIIDKYKTDMED